MSIFFFSLIGEGLLIHRTVHTRTNKEKKNACCWVGTFRPTEKAFDSSLKELGNACASPSPPNQLQPTASNHDSTGFTVQQLTDSSIVT